MLGQNQALAGVLKEEGTGTVSAFGVAGGEAALAEERGLLIACHAADRQTIRQETEPGAAAEIAGTRADLGQHSARHAKETAQVIVPGATAEVEKERARAVGVVGGVYFAAGELPQQPAVDGAGREFASVSLTAPTAVLLEKPAQLRSREVRIKHQSSALENPRFLLLIRAAKFVGAAALPS